jgi:circadian clock protein KaiC
MEAGGERNRGLYVLKSRGMAHSNQVREFLLTSHGVQLNDVYVGPEGVLTGSMRVAQEAREKAAEQERRREIEARLRNLERTRLAREAQIAALRSEMEEEEQAVRALIATETERVRLHDQERELMGKMRNADAPDRETSSKESEPELGTGVGN